LNPEKARKQLFKYLDDCLALSHKKLHANHSKQQLRLSWGRLMVQAIGAYGKLLETEELEQRVKKLEEQIQGGVVIPNEQNSKR